MATETVESILESVQGLTSEQLRDLAECVKDFENKIGVRYSIFTF